MASLEQRFRAIERESPNHSSLINFSRAISGQPLSKSRVAFYFRKLVEKEDYARSDRLEVLDYLYLKIGHAGIKVFQSSRHLKSTKNALRRSKGTPLRPPTLSYA